LSLLAWNDSFLIGIPEIDKQHEHMFDILNRVEAAMQAGGQKRDVIRTLSELASYTRYHFSAEENLMRASGFPGTAEHVRRHQTMQSQAEDYTDDIYAGRTVVMLKLLAALKDGLSHHILEDDHRFASYYLRSNAA
jgi:hemerythrin